MSCYSEEDQTISYQSCPNQWHWIFIELGREKLHGEIELNVIYRPEERYQQHGVAAIWIWADHNKENCTHHQRTFDCYLEPIAAAVKVALSMLLLPWRTSS